MDKTRIERVVLIVLDSVGVGSQDDAADYGDAGANTLGHISEACGGLMLPNMEKLGLGRIHPLRGISPVMNPLGSWGLMTEQSRGKDTIAGHWEMMGLVLNEPFALFAQGFPEDFVDSFMKRVGVAGILGNKAASGTEIIAELGAAHVRTGFPIIYTSADSVLQIAAHETVIPVGRLYEICLEARKLCDAYRIGRVIARPFIGSAGNFKRTSKRRDFPMLPPKETVLDVLRKNGLPVVAIGKIENIFAGKGIASSFPSHSNREGMDLLRQQLSLLKRGLLFVNLVDFDMLFGHRRDTAGYAGALEEFDAELGNLMPQLGPGDMLIITADHGCDPTHPGTDHTREHVPLLVYSPVLKSRSLGKRNCFADVGATVLDVFDIAHDFPGMSVLTADHYVG